jgi:SAM-dependent methyltransferase
MASQPYSPSVPELIARRAAAKGAARLSPNELGQLYWTFHPRFRFFKSVPANARLLDIGANNGGLSQWRKWQSPDRSDISMYGVDLSRGEFADNYAGWESQNLDEAMPRFPGVTFDAVLCSHLIEHIQRPQDLFGWLGTRTRPGARCYFEWPNLTSLSLPPRGDLAEAGWNVMISNFHDDYTHRELKSLDDVAAMMADAGFTIIERGVVDAGYLTDQLIDAGDVYGDDQLSLQGFWSATHWSTYFIALRNG